MIRWFSEKKSFDAAVALLEPYRQKGEEWAAGRKTVDGYCVCCRTVVEFKVVGGSTFGARVNLREGLVCPRCHLSNRGRLLYQAVLESLGETSQSGFALLEQTTPLYRCVQQRWPHVIGSEFLDPSFRSGVDYPWRGAPVRHESISGLSYADGSLALIVHNDVLEHVHEYRAALAETARVLAPGGCSIFTMPFFMSRLDPAELARPRADGSIEIFGKPEYHGDGIRAEGILTYYHFGWHLIDDLRAAGFRSAEVGLCYDLFLGFSTNNHPNFDYGLMYPIVLRAIR